jgi:hypothetical protein
LRSLKEVIALSSMIVLPRAMSLGPSLAEGFMEKSYLYPLSQQQAQCGWVYMYEVRVNNKITMTKACYHEGVDYRSCEFELVESSMEGFLVCMNRIQCSNLLLADSV